MNTSAIPLVVFLFSQSVLFSQTEYYRYRSELIQLHPVEGESIVQSMDGGPLVFGPGIEVLEFYSADLVRVTDLPEGFSSEESQEWFVHPLYEYSDGNPCVMRSEIVFSWLSEPSELELSELMNQVGFVEDVSSEFLQLWKVDSPLTACEIMWNSGFVKFCEPNRIVEIEQAEHIPNDGRFHRQWNLAYIDGVTAYNDDEIGNPNVNIRATEAWELTTGDPDLIVANVDVTGVTFPHPDLPAYRQLRLSGSNPNPEISDDPSPTTGYDFDGSGLDNHGNATAGIIGAEMGNNYGVAGVAPACQIMPVVMVNTTANMAAMMHFARQYGARVINCSWGTPSSDSFEDAIQSCVDEDVVVCFATGNSSDHNQGCTDESISNEMDLFPTVFVVGAVGHDGLQADYSNSDPVNSICGPSSADVPSLFAGCQCDDVPFCIQLPGKAPNIWTIDIPTSEVFEDAGYNPWSWGSEGDVPVFAEALPEDDSNLTGRFWGTSAATPHVSATAALILSANSCLTGVEVFEIITQTATHVSEETYDYSGDGRNDELGYGLVNAKSAVDEALALFGHTFEVEVLSHACANGATAEFIVTSSSELEVELIRRDVNVNIYDVDLGNDNHPENQTIPLNSNVEIEFNEDFRYFVRVGYTDPNNGASQCTSTRQVWFNGPDLNFSSIGADCESGLASVEFTADVPYTLNDNVDWVLDDSQVGTDVDQLSLDLPLGIHSVTIQSATAGTCTAEVSIGVNPDSFDYPSLETITEPTTAFDNSVVSFGEGLTVAAGEVIFNNVHLIFGAGAALVIEEGATFTCNNCTMESCGGMWLGVEVRGGSFDFVDTVEDGFTPSISDAHIGVLFGTRNPAFELGGVQFPFLPVDASGNIGTLSGVAAFDGVSFVNCGEGIHVSPNEISVQASYPHIGIRNCSFVTQGQLNNPFYLESTEGSYPNDQNPYSQSNYLGVSNYGIVVDRSYSVTEIEGCYFDRVKAGIRLISRRPNVVGSTFFDCQFGIVQTDAHVTPFSVGIQRIEDNTFRRIIDPEDPCGQNQDYFNAEYLVSNSGAIVISKSDFIQIVGNGVFANEDIDDDCGLPVDFSENGILLDNCRNVHVDKCELEYPKRGIVVVNSSPEPEGWLQAYSMLVGPLYSSDDLPETEERNTLTGCEVGVLTDGVNRRLYLRCIDHFEGELETPYEVSWANTGIMRNQGVASVIPGEQVLAAGNRWIDTEKNEIASLYSVESFDYTYVHHGFSEDSGTPVEFLVPETNEMDGISVFGDNNQTYDPIPSCSNPFKVFSSYDDGPFEPWLVAKKNALQDQINELETVRASIDAWHAQTESMLTAIYMSDDELELKQTLEANSPLSDQVLIAYMERFNVPDTYFRDVMALNAEVNQELLGLLKQRVQDMPQAIAAEIATIMVNNPEVLTEARLTRTLDQSSAEMGMALFTYLDNLATNQHVADLLENHTMLWPENQIASLMEKEQWVEASALIGDYCSQASQSTAMQVLYTTEMSLRQELRRMTPEELVEVQAILNQESPATEAYCKAKCMLMEQGVEVPQVIRRLFVQPQERLARNQDNSRETVLAVFPNPADDYCKVELAEPAGADATIELIAPSGQLVDVLALEAGSTSTYLYLEGVAVGTYQLIYRQSGIQLGQTTLIIVQ